MLSFLKHTRKLVNARETICIVLGNESCDLDSACSAITLAFFYQNNAAVTEKHTNAKQFLPVLNIPKRDYPFKTEVKFLLNKYEITESMLTFRDELDADFLARCDFVLVDHHLSPFAAQCVAVYDHRPKESASFPQGCYVNIAKVGSCATLVAAKYLECGGIKDLGMEQLIVALEMLRSTIVLDTVNFSTSAARATEEDCDICCRLEHLLEMQTALQTRDEVFQSLCEARADVNGLTAAQLLRKDLKILTSVAGNVTIALPGFPLQVQKFIQKPDAAEALKLFASENRCDVILLIGMFVSEDGGVERDIGLINFAENLELWASVEQELLTLADPSLSLELCEDCAFMGGRFYKQKNIKATRKHILPIVKQLLEK